MTDTIQQPARAETGIAFQTAYNTARVAGVFVLIFFGLLVANFIGTSVIGPRRENKLAAMKDLLRQDPAN